MVTSTPNEEEKSYNDEDDATLKIMLEEDKKLSDGFWHLVAMGESRLRFLLTLIAGVAAAISLAIQNLETVFANTIGGFLYAGLILFGLATFLRTVKRSIGIRICAEELKKIRLYFNDNYPRIKGTLMLPDDQLTDLFATTRFSIRLKWFTVYFDTPGIVALINSILLGLGAVLLLVGLPDVQPSIFISVSIGLSLFSLYLQTRHYKNEIEELDGKLNKKNKLNTTENKEED